MKKLIRELKKKNKDIPQNIFNSMTNVNMNCIIGYHKDKEKHSFIEEYEKNGN